MFATLGDVAGGQGLEHGQQEVRLPTRRLGPIGPVLAVALSALGFALTANFASQIVAAEPLVDRLLACEPEVFLDAGTELVAAGSSVDECAEASQAAFREDGVDFVTRSVHQRAQLFYTAVGLAALALAWLTPFIGRRHKLTRWSIAATAVFSLLTLVAIAAQYWYGDTIVVLTEVYYR